MTHHWVVPNTLFFTHIFQLSSCGRAQKINKLMSIELAVLAYLGGVKNLYVEIGQVAHVQVFQMGQ